MPNDPLDELLPQAEDLALRGFDIVWTRMQAHAGQISASESTAALRFELAEVPDPVVLLSVVADISASTLELVAELLQRDSSLVLEGMREQLLSRHRKGGG